MPSRPVSAAFRLDGSSGSIECLENALAWVDKVHADGELSEIVGIARPFGDKEQRDGETLRGFLDFRTRTVSINLKEETPEFTALHEIGHVLDHWGFGQGPSVVGRVLDFEDWRVAIFRTQAWRHLYEMVTIPGHRWIDPITGLTLQADDGDVKHARYLLQWDELWARSYAQYIAAISKQMIARTQLNRIRDSAYGLFYGAQWTDEDFKGVLKAVDGLMAAKGWRRHMGNEGLLEESMESVNDA